MVCGPRGAHRRPVRQAARREANAAGKEQMCSRRSFAEISCPRKLIGSAEMPREWLETGNERLFGCQKANSVTSLRPRIGLPRRRIWPSAPASVCGAASWGGRPWRSRRAYLVSKCHGWAKSEFHHTTMHDIVQKTAQDCGHF